ncbi:NADH dehydrogenase [ubiquinone] 1 beta subcomplex subunit 7-like [Paramacrobiotus metropolitanus]|uniref:NADH dehydrogenase [ubiquinone] 1 beta subcomplex subunit 7-like n=1 Tax=Paramacrobiotus metropolitanus TaxID=2943436 RepID=UPI0024463083|nr:NADH dehydrogenase [ubiquinone] 1 beta subcomplex subunit 7-like [Paramacrobiotus metropolitanus]
MGNIAYSSWGQYWEAFVYERKAAPDVMRDPTFDPNFGFAEPRKERVMVATEAEMEAANLTLAERDFCAHLLIDWKKCMRSNFPCYWRCYDQKHHYHECEAHDSTLRYKEYERERRLKLRWLEVRGLDPNGNPLPQKKVHA